MRMKQTGWKDAPIMVDYTGGGWKFDGGGVRIGEIFLYKLSACGLSYISFQRSLMFCHSDDIIYPWSFLIPIVQTMHHNYFAFIILLD